MMQIRLIIAAILLALGGFLVWFIPSHYKEQGRQEVIQKYQEASRLALLERNAEIERLKKDHEATNKIIQADYEARLSVLNDKYLAARSVGLRMPKTACDGLAASAEAASAKANNAIESIRLPSDVEDGLFDLARKADEVNLQLSACQAWIKKTGFN